MLKPRACTCRDLRVCCHHRPPSYEPTISMAAGHPMLRVCMINGGSTGPLFQSGFLSLVFLVCAPFFHFWGVFSFHHHNTGRPTNLTIEFSLKSPCLWASFHPLAPLSVVSTKWGNFIKSQHEMHNNANKVHFSCPVAAVKWPFQYFFLDKVFQWNGAKLLWVDKYALCYKGAHRRELLLSMGRGWSRW